MKDKTVPETKNSPDSDTKRFSLPEMPSPQYLDELSEEEATQAIKDAKDNLKAYLLTLDRKDRAVARREAKSIQSQAMRSYLDSLSKAPRIPSKKEFASLPAPEWKLKIAEAQKARTAYLDSLPKRRLKRVLAMEKAEQRTEILSVLGNTSKKYSMLIALIAVILFFGISTQGVLLAPRNVSNLIFQNSYVAILAVGMLLCILTGGNIDLSVGSVVGFVGAVAGELMINRKIGVLPTIIVCLLLGLFIGFFQGGCIAYIGVPPFIATLAGMMIFRGLTQFVLRGLTLAPFPDDFLKLSTGHIEDFFPIQSIPLNITCLLFGFTATAIFVILKLVGRFRKIKKGYETGSTTMFIVNIVLISVALIAVTIRLAEYKGIPTVFFILLAIVLIYATLTSNTVPGRYLYALGGNAKAARLSGINTKRVMFLAYTNMSFLAAVAALVFAARLNSANPTAGLSFELDAIGSCFIGGASAYGGIGTVGGVLIGATFMGVMNNGMNILGFDTAVQQVVKGLVLLVAVAFDVVSKRKSR